MDAPASAVLTCLRRDWGRASFARRSLQGFPGPSRRSKREFRGRRRDRYPSARRSGENVFGNPQDPRNQRPRRPFRRWLHRVISRCADDCARGIHGFGNQRRPQSQLSAGEIQTFLPDRGTFRFPSPYFYPGSARDERQRLRRDGLRPPGRLLLLEQHQQPCRQRHDVDFSGPRAPARRRRTHALQLQQAHGSGAQRWPALSKRQPIQLGHGRGVVLQRQAADDAVCQRAGGIHAPAL